MEKYLNSNFAEADEQSIKTLQGYLNKLGYRNTEGKKLDVNGEFNDETKSALVQAKEDFQLYKKIKGKHFLLTGLEYHTYVRETNELIYLNENAKNKILEDLVSNKIDLNSGFLVAGENLDKIFLMPIDPKDPSDTLTNKPKEANTLIKENKRKINGAACSVVELNEQKKYLENSLSGYNVKYEISKKPTIRSFGYYYNNSGFDDLLSYSFQYVPYSDDVKLKRIAKFDDVKVPPKPKKKDVVIGEPATQPEKTVTEITPTENLCDKLQKDWSEFVKKAAGFDKDGTTPEETQKLKEEVEKFNKSHKENPITITPQPNGKIKYKITPCRE